MVFTKVAILIYIKSFVVYFVCLSLVQNINNDSEAVGLNGHILRVLHTPGVIYNEPGLATKNAHSDVGVHVQGDMTMHAVTIAAAGYSQQSTNSDYVSYHFLI